MGEGFGSGASEASEPQTSPGPGVGGVTRGLLEKADGGAVDNTSLRAPRPQAQAVHPGAAGREGLGRVPRPEEAPALGRPSKGPRDPSPRSQLTAEANERAARTPSRASPGPRPRPPRRRLRNGGGDRGRSPRGGPGPSREPQPMTASRTFLSSKDGVLTTQVGRVARSKHEKGKVGRGSGVLQVKGKPQISAFGECAAPDRPTGTESANQRRAGRGCAGAEWPQRDRSGEDHSSPHPPPFHPLPRDCKQNSSGNARALAGPGGCAGARGWWEKKGGGRFGGRQTKGAWRPPLPLPRVAPSAPSRRPSPAPLALPRFASGRGGGCGLGPGRSGARGIPPRPPLPSHQGCGLRYLCALPPSRRPRPPAACRLRSPPAARRRWLPSAGPSVRLAPPLRSAAPPPCPRPRGPRARARSPVPPPLAPANGRAPPPPPPRTPRCPKGPPAPCRLGRGGAGMSTRGSARPPLRRSGRARRLLLGVAFPREIVRRGPAPGAPGRGPGHGEVAGSGAERGRAPGAEGLRAP
ncbi:basic proline-rich protein-like [Dromiciops gliroides]|uniref:basic proline-rich protein-like n=1 Tax=Dromiciops gliroides TaxID=33562 RepID=UPI001CC41893|nr:basic proline-rich protein-like [Dromiciops gliroides]